MKQINFSNNLQPIPTDTAPNFSKNINATSSDIFYTPIEETNTTSEPTVPQPPQKEIPQSNVSIIYWIIPSLIILVLIFIGFKKLYK